MQKAIEAATEAGNAEFGEIGAKVGKEAGEAAAKEVASRLGRQLGAEAGLIAGKNTINKGLSFNFIRRLKKRRTL